MVSTNTPPSAIDCSCLASATVCGPAFHAWSTRSCAAASPSTCSHWNSTPRHDESVVLDVAIADLDALGVGLDGGGHLVQDSYAVAAEAAVAEAEAADRVH